MLENPFRHLGVRGFDSFLGMVPLPETMSEEDYYVAASTFEFDRLKQDDFLALLLREHLTLLDENQPNGKGAILAFYSQQTKELSHLCLGRVIGEEGVGLRAYIGLRYTPEESPLLRFDAWPVAHSDLFERVRADHRTTGMTLLVDGEEFLSMVNELFHVRDRILSLKDSNEAT